MPRGQKRRLLQWESGDRLIAFLPFLIPTDTTVGSCHSLRTQNSVNARLFRNPASQIASPSEHMLGIHWPPWSPGARESPGLEKNTCPRSHSHNCSKGKDGEEEEGALGPAGKPPSPLGWHGRPFPLRRSKPSTETGSAGAGQEPGKGAFHGGRPGPGGTEGGRKRGGLSSSFLTNPA